MCPKTGLDAMENIKICLGIVLEGITDFTQQSVVIAELVRFL
jgi:hypothetical protein